MAVAAAKGKLIAVIGDEDTCVGFLLGGIGEINKHRQPNFMVVDKNTSVGEIEECFKRFLKRDDIDIILINQNVAELIRHVIDLHHSPIPAVLEIPSKDHPYDATKDSILRRAKDQEMPIDIQCPKLLDWLLSRRLCPKTWHDQALSIREKINAAIQDMPEHKDITQLLSGTYINYFHCLQIIDILKETEADTKNIFGRYGSQRMKDWQDIVRLYEKDNVYLAEAAQILTRNVTYDIPGIKRQMAKCEQVQLECERKEADCLKNASDLRDKYYASCKQIGIEGKHVKRELVNLLQDLPGLYTAIAKEVDILKEPRHLYQQFIAYILENPVMEDDTCLPLLKYIMEHGNTTTYEWRYGEAPLKIEEPPINIQLEDETSVVDNQIDFDDGIDFGGANAGTDFGEITLETGDIDWGAMDVAAEVDPSSVGELDLGDQVEMSGIVVEETGIEGGVAREAEALTLLDAVQTRNLFTDELLELEAFLVQRIQENTSQGQNFSLTQLPTALQLSSDQLSSMLADVRSMLRLLNDIKLQHLALIRASPRYVDRLALSLQQKMHLADKMEASREKAERRRKDASAEQCILQPKLQILSARSKVLKRQLETDIGKRYKNRSVSIMGAGV
nr:EOG090X07S9 [Lepidurus arcticus]